jgi:hypothetical protein
VSNTYNRIPVASQLGMLFLPSKPLPKTLSSQACLLTPRERSTPKTPRLCTIQATPPSAFHPLLVVLLAVVIVVAVVGNEFVVCNVDCKCAECDAEAGE